MEFLQLRYFCVSAERESFSYTARLFRVPVSGVSSSVKRLEEELGVQLFCRSANKITLSEQGRMFYEEASRALEILDQARERAGQNNPAVNGKISLAVCVNFALVNQLAMEFMREYPDVDFQIDSGLKARHAKYDLIFSDELLFIKGRQMKTFLKENMLLAAAKTNPAILPDGVDPEQLKRQKFITGFPGSSIYHHNNLICYDWGFEPNITVFVDNVDEMQRYISADMGVGIVPEYAVAGKIPENVCLRKLGEYQRRTCIFFEKEKQRSRAVDLFLEKCLHYKEQFD